MKVILTKKESTIRLFTEPEISCLTAFWLGKRVREFEEKTGYKVYYVKGQIPQGFMGFWGTKIIDTEGRNEEECAEIIIDTLFEILKKEGK